MALRMMGGYSYRDGLLYKDVWDYTSLSFSPKVVVPKGGLRAFRYNGRLYKLPLRRQLLLNFHDSECMGMHSSAEETLLKLEKLYFWPGMEHDTQRWMGSCAVCRLIKPSRGLAADARMELYDGRSG